MEKKEYTTKEVKKNRESKWTQRGLGGCPEWDSIDDLPLLEEQKKCVLEWLAQRLRREQVARDCDIWGYGKSYDPLWIDGNTAHSYVIDMADGGRHHSYKNMAEIEYYIFKEYFEMIECELHHERFCGWCGERKENGNHKKCETYLTNPPK